MVAGLNDLRGASLYTAIAHCQSK